MSTESEATETWDDVLKRPFTTYADAPEECRAQLRQMHEDCVWPWIVEVVPPDRCEYEGHAGIVADPHGAAIRVTHGMFVADAYLAGMARNAVPFMLDEIERLEAENERLRGAGADG